MKIEQSKELILNNHKFLLVPEKALYWESQNTLIISDLHLGKVNHFRKAGIPVPAAANRKNVERLIALLQNTNPERVIFLGDLFHSHYNQEWEVFGQVLNHFPQISFELVRGNHDILSDHQYVKHQLKIHEQSLRIEGFIFTHEPMDEIPTGYYAIAGHVHPGVMMKGKGRQRLKFPCYWFGKEQALLPAFGEFTGLFIVSPKENDAVFLIMNDQVIRG